MIQQVKRHRQSQKAEHIAPVGGGPNSPQKSEKAFLCSRLSVKLRHDAVRTRCVDERCVGAV